MQSSLHLGGLRLNSSYEALSPRPVTNSHVCKPAPSLAVYLLGQRTGEPFPCLNCLETQAAFHAVA